MTKYTAIRPDQAFGKTVKGIAAISDRMLIAFTDGTALVLVAEDDNYDPSSLRCSINGSLWYYGDAAVRAGLVTKSEMEEIHRMAMIESEAQEQQRERSELARLKAKYEGTSP